MLGIAVLLAGAALAHAIARAAGIPPVPILLLAGVALASTGMLPEVFLEEALILGVTFLLFVTGLELNPKRTRRQTRAALRVGSLQFVTLAGAGAAAAHLMGFAPVESLYVGLALTASSTLVVIRLLQRRRQMFEPFGRLVLGVLLLQDLLVILAIPLVTDLPRGPEALAGGLVATAVLLTLTYAVFRWGSPLVTRLDGDEEAVLLVAIAVLFVFLGIAAALAIPLVAGAFLAGVALSRFPASGIVRAQLASVGDFFSAIFFTALGALIGVPTGTELAQAVLLALLVVVMTPPLVATVAERAGFSARPAVAAGLLLSQTSELSLVVGLYGVIEGQIPATVFTVIALTTMITMVLTPFLTADPVVWRLLRLHPVRVEAQSPIPDGGHVLVLGSGTTGTPLLETLLGTDYEVVVVDDDPAVIERLREADVACIRGDASDLEVLEKANARKARIIVSTIRRPEDNGRLLRYAHGVPVLARVFDASDAGWIRAMGGTPVVYSEAAAEGLLNWFEANLRPG